MRDVAIKAGYSVAGQALQSLSSFCVLALCVRYLSTDSYGHLAVALSYLGIVSGIISPTLSTQIAIRTSISSRKVSSLLAESAIYSAAPFVLFFSLVLTFAIGLLSNLSLTISAAAAGYASLFGARLLLKATSQAKNRYLSSFLSDGVFSFFSMGLFFSLVWTIGSPSPVQVISCFLVGAFASLFVLYSGIQVRFKTVTARSSMRRYLRLKAEILSASAGAIIASLTNAFPAFIVSVVSSPSGYAYVAASGIIAGMVRLAMLPLQTVLRIEFAKLLSATDIMAARRFCIYVTAGICLLCVAGLVLFVLTWPMIYEALYDTKYNRSRIFICCIISFLVCSVQFARISPVSLLVAQKKFRQLLKVQMISGTIGVIATLSVILTFSFDYALIGLLSSEFISLIVELFLALTKKRHVSLASAVVV